MRCKSSLSEPLKVDVSDKKVGKDSAGPDRSKLRFAAIITAIVIISLAALVFYLRQVPQGPPDVAAAEDIVAQKPVASAAEPAPDAVDQTPQSESAGKQIITNLKRFQDITESGIDYIEYDKRLTKLRNDLNETLPSFVRHEPGDETFRQEVASALRDYTAAGNWWKTTITNNTVFTEADRKERTQRMFESARTHLENAEHALVR